MDEYKRGSVRYDGKAEATYVVSRRHCPPSCQDVKKPGKAINYDKRQDPSNKPIRNTGNTMWKKGEGKHLTLNIEFSRR